MLPYRDSRITRIVLVVFFILIIGYAYYEARGVLYGPNIDISTAVTEVTDPFITISGTAERISELSMNGKPISVTEAGVFEESYLLAPGLNRIMLDATDRYGRKTQEIILVVYRVDPNAPKTPAIQATSSIESSSTVPQNP